MKQERKFYQRSFLAWVRSRGIKVLVESDLTNLKVGDCVIYTDKFGIRLFGRTVLGFCEPVGTNCVFLDNYNYWIPVSPESLKKIIIEKKTECKKIIKGGNS